MNSASLRRLAADQASLRRSTPPNYLFPDGDEGALPDDLTQLAILLTGAQGTPYSHGLWRLQLRMPEDYPKNPPKATFQTRIFHPNVEESTGAVCLDSLKKDWQAKLTLRDILVTISCLLIHPNPDSALNAEAGALLQEDYEAFARKAKLMTSIHAPIPRVLKDAVLQAMRRGEEDGMGPSIAAPERPAGPRAHSSSTSIVMKSKTGAPKEQPPAVIEDDDQEDDAKENDPSHSPSSTLRPAPSAVRKVLGKRPLSELPAPIDLDDAAAADVTGEDNLSPSERNINANRSRPSSRQASSEPVKKSPKLARSAPDGGISDHLAHSPALEICEDDSATTPQEEKENISIVSLEGVVRGKKSADPSPGASGPVRPTLRKVSNIGSSRGKAQPRVGIRRL